MPKDKRQSPATGRAGNGPDPAAIRRALAIEIMDQELAGDLREKRKRHRKVAEGNGVDLAELDRFYKLRDSTEDEIETFFRNMWRHASAIFTGLADQLDLFVQKSPREKLATFRHVGMMVGIRGLPAEAPPNLVGDQLQAWLAGHHEGATARDEAKDELADTLADALKTSEAGGVVDGTGRKRRGAGKNAAKAAAVADQAAKDFAADNPDTKLPLEEGGAKGDGFEATDEELAAQKGRKGAEDASDPLVVGGVRYPNKTRANEARKLAEQNAGVQARAIEEAKRPDSVA